MSEQRRYELRQCFICGIKLDEQEFEEFIKAERKHVKDTRIITITSRYTGNEYCICGKCLEWLKQI